MTTASPAGATAAAPTGQPDAARAAAVDSFLDGFFRLEPVTASFAGVRDHDHRLPDWSPEGLESARAERERLRHELADAGLGNLPDDALARQDWNTIDAALADACLEIQIAEDSSRHFVRRNPSLAIGEAAFSLVALAWDADRPGTRVIESAMARLEAIPGFLAGVQRSSGVAAVPQAWKERALRECDGARDLIGDLGDWLSVHSVDRARQRLRDVVSGVMASVDAFRAAIDARPVADDASCAVGSDLLELTLRRGHWCETALDDLRNDARESLREECARLDDLVRTAGAGSWATVSDRIANHHPASAAVLDACHATWHEARALASDQVTWPGIGIRYHAMPSWARRGAPRLYYLMYRSPAPMQDPVEDRYAVPVPASGADAAVRDGFERAWNHAAIKLNHVAHHGGLGHHVQNWHAARSASRVSRIAAVDGASRIAMIAGGTMAEGWACYATEVMERLGFLTPDERMSEQHTRVRLMVRAVVDLELHSGRLSFADAVRLHHDVAGLSEVAARAEVTKCSMFPGTASMYWIGLRELWRIRGDEVAARGSAFDVREFHDRVLACGSMPVPLVGRLLAAARGA